MNDEQQHTNIRLSKYLFQLYT